ncbi:hypothetical protein IHQ68_12775 [Chelatococcus sambhunathii]|uniref:Uncharacterized protein n=1 Tax=Chelatococcus sambhunathii TaxID=363953 RepID=A0ABU1DHE7_9HYPH|nr:DUF6477 family protein [Chelatococcus sambhunathii]MDR4307491.1 hypothetical protein [Chelatococcus sambhunathii]
MQDERRTAAAATRSASGPDRGAIRSWRPAADEALAAAVTIGAGSYDRARLPRLVGVDIRQLAEPGPALDAAIRAKLERALRAERQRGAAGCWTYDLNRHLALIQALEAENRRSAAPASGRRKQKGRPAGKAGRRGA